MKITLTGSGYVGRATGACPAELGNATPMQHMSFDGRNLFEHAAMKPAGIGRVAIGCGAPDELAA